MIDYSEYTVRVPKVLRDGSVNTPFEVVAGNTPEIFGRILQHEFPGISTEVCEGPDEVIVTGPDEETSAEIVSFIYDTKSTIPASTLAC